MPGWDNFPSACASDRNFFLASSQACLPNCPGQTVRFCRAQPPFEGKNSLTATARGIFVSLPRYVIANPPWPSFFPTRYAPWPRSAPTGRDSVAAAGVAMVFPQAVHVWAASALSVPQAVQTIISVSALDRPTATLERLLIRSYTAGRTYSAILPKFQSPYGSRPMLEHYHYLILLIPSLSSLCGRLGQSSFASAQKWCP